MTSEGLIFDLKRFAVHDGPGVRTTVFLKGCPLDCAWCHNPESRLAAPEPARGRARRLPDGFGERAGVIGAKVNARQVLDFVERDRAYFEESGGGMTLSGGEPLLQPRFAAELLAGARERGIHTAVDTSGAVAWSAFEACLPWCDLFLYDFKVLSPDAHARWVGGYRDAILANLGRLLEAGACVRMRIPLIPGISDTRANLVAAADLAASLPELEGVDLLPYNPAGEHKYTRLGLPLRSGHHLPQSTLELSKAKAFFTDRSVPVSLGGSP